MHRNHGVTRRQKPLAGNGCLVWAHCALAADRQEDVGRLVETVNEGHVAEDVGVAGMINGWPTTREGDHPAGGRPS